MDLNARLNDTKDYALSSVLGMISLIAIAVIFLGPMALLIWLGPIVFSFILESLGLAIAVIGSILLSLAYSFAHFFIGYFAFHFAEDKGWFPWV